MPPHQSRYIAASSEMSHAATHSANILTVSASADARSSLKYRRSPSSTHVAPRCTPSWPTSDSTCCWNSPSSTVRAPVVQPLPLRDGARAQSMRWHMAKRGGRTGGLAGMSSQNCGASWPGGSAAFPSSCASETASRRRSVRSRMGCRRFVEAIRCRRLQSAGRAVLSHRAMCDDYSFAVDLKRNGSNIRARRNEQDKLESVVRVEK